MLDRTIAKAPARHQTRRRFLIAGFGAFGVLATSDAFRGMACALSGPSDGSADADKTMVVAGIKAARLCMECITAKTGVSPARVAEILKRAQVTVRLAAEGASCDRCLRNMTVYGLGWRRQRLSA